MPANKPPSKPGTSAERLDRIVAEARRGREQREAGYRERALRIYPWVCGRCAREFTHANLQMLTVHHRDHNHDNNPPDGSNWELLCIYCHENEHARFTDHGYVDQVAQQQSAGAAAPDALATYKPFAGLEALLKGKK